MKKINLEAKVNRKQDKTKIITGPPEPLMGNDGDQIISKTNAGYSMYVKIDGKWWFTGEPLKPVADGQGELLSRKKARKGVFSTIELTNTPKKTTQLGVINGHITNGSFGRGTGLSGDILISHSASATVSNANWTFLNDGAAYDTSNNSLSAVGATISLAASFWRAAFVMMPFDCNLSTYSITFGDDAGLSASGTQQVAILKRPSASHGTTVRNDNSSATWTVIAFASKTATTAANSLNHVNVVNVQDGSATAKTSYSIGAGDQIGFAYKNSEFSSGTKSYIRASLYCKIK